MSCRASQSHQNYKMFLNKPRAYALLTIVSLGFSRMACSLIEGNPALLEISKFANQSPDLNKIEQQDGPSSAITNPSATTTSGSDKNGIISTTPTTQTTTDPNADPDDLPVSTHGSGYSMSTSMPNPDDSVKTQVTTMKPAVEGHSIIGKNEGLEFEILLYSLFIAYVSFIKLIYNSITLINYNLNEPGILMIFGIIWELVARQVSSNYDHFPRFNSRIFFYLFLPSTVLESASLLSNKWLFLNLLPILIHSILGTILYATAMGFTFYTLGQQNIFNLNLKPTIMAQTFALTRSSNFNQHNASLLREEAIMDQQVGPDKGFLVTSSALEWSNLTLSDCLIFGTILSSIDSNTMLGIFKLLQVNERLYYLALGENLMNNAVVLVLFTLLLEFFTATRLTVVKIYVAILQFFLTLIGSFFIGLVLACVALVAIRLTKRFQVPTAMTNYQNQYHAMVETLLILKLAYLAYTLAYLAGTSRIVSLATFGILQDQYIKHNLNLRSQLTFRQVIMATKTLGFSLVYPLLGMLLVEVADSGQIFSTWMSPGAPAVGEVSNKLTKLGVLSTAGQAASRLSNLASQANLYWNFKFLSIAMVVVVVYRFIIVIVLSSVSNLFSSHQMKITFKEQIMVAYGGLKGPLAVALVQRLIDHEDYRERAVMNKHLLMYTILFITFVSTVIFGSFIKPIVTKFQRNSDGYPSSNLKHQFQRNSAALSHANSHKRALVVFEQLNQRVTEYVARGLNSILGHSKSPWDRFADLNETHLKPWLARSGSNTNWLSVFYDNLILDETLNAQCFYRTTEAARRNKQQLREQRERELLEQHQLQMQQLVSNRRVGGLRRTSAGLGSSGSKLDTIDENNQSVVPRRHRKDAPGSRASVTFSAATDDDEATNKSSAFATTAHKDALKEFVLLNLRLEEAQQRKHGLQFEATGRQSYLKRAPSSESHESYQRQANFAVPLGTSAGKSRRGMIGEEHPGNLIRALSSTSSDIGGELSSAGDDRDDNRKNRRHVRDKHKHLNQVERLLLEGVEPKNMPPIEVHGAGADPPPRRDATALVVRPKLEINEPNDAVNNSISQEQSHRLTVAHDWFDPPDESYSVRVPPVRHNRRSVRTKVHPGPHHGAGSHQQRAGHHRQLQRGVQ